jgi:hypothetical protein
VWSVESDKKKKLEEIQHVRRKERERERARENKKTTNQK